MPGQSILPMTNFEDTQILTEDRLVYINGGKEKCASWLWLDLDDVGIHSFSTPIWSLNTVHRSCLLSVLTFKNSKTASVIAYAEPVDGVAYMLDEVLLPSFLSQSIVDVAASATSTLASLVVAAGYEEVLSSPDADLTVFAPTDEAFAALDPELLAFLQTPDGLETLQAVLAYHVLPDVYASVNIPEGSTEIASLEGQTLTVTRDATAVTVNGVAVSVPDVLANNGIVHVISEVSFALRVSALLKDFSALCSFFLSSLHLLLI